MDEYAMVSCRGLCQKLHATLPQELRDKVYEQVLGMANIQVSEKNGRGIVRDRVPCGVGIPDYLSLLHYWDPAWVGLNFLKELARDWYRVTTFDFNYRTNLIPRFLDENIWGQGLRPRELVSKVKIHVPAIRLRSPKTLEELENLFGFKNRVNLHIDISSAWFVEWGEHERLFPKSTWRALEKAMEVILPIFPVLNRFLDAGFRLSVWLNSLCDITPHNAKFSSEKCLKVV
ncbi:hypothetical protein K505DRAFT_376773 [Melanomma pulvis-pyrius CBS 109.77]|uniref:Uncharacterized protein n=1 Tax=Melanomma pulvis-pyrius CBS 109.77 TaxID=1314802 RepID=A0A6A6X5J7_9PLEO|nr:hypothetical protein K505DRAFT_376773 [Melanomma pulvis-pyrius CBS 109.77]